MDPAPSEGLPPVTSPGVVVVGMHRSGTSAVTRVLHLLGLRVPTGEDLMGPDASNPAGYFESRSLVFLNDELLLSLGGTWSAPPVLDPGWERGPMASSLAERAAEAFLRAFPVEPWVWKDPRLCITLPFWDRLLGRRPAVAVFRSPGEVVRSLEVSREGHHPSLGLALWNRYTGAMLRNLEDRPAYVSDWARVRDDPVAWCSALREWLLAVDVPISEERAGQAAEAIDSSLSRVPRGGAEESGVPLDREDHLLLERLHGLEGSHTRVPTVDIPPESAARVALLEERRQLEVATLIRLGGVAHERETLEDYVRMLEHELERKNALIDRLQARPDLQPRDEQESSR